MFCAKERDAWLKEQLRGLATLLDAQKEQLASVDGQVAEAAARADKIAHQTSAAQKDFEKRRKAVHAAAEAIAKVGKFLCEKKKVCD